MKQTTRKRLAELCDAVDTNPASQGVHRDLAKAVRSLLSDGDAGGGVPGFLDPDAPTSPSYPGQGREPATRGLQGEELAELNRAMRMPENRPQFEVNGLGELIVRYIGPTEVRRRLAAGDERVDMIVRTVPAPSFGKLRRLP